MGGEGRGATAGRVVVFHQGQVQESQEAADTKENTTLIVARDGDLRVAGADRVAFGTGSLCAVGRDSYPDGNAGGVHGTRHDRPPNPASRKDLLFYTRYGR